MRRTRMRAKPQRIPRLLRQLSSNEFPAQVAIRRHGRCVARLVRENDYQEVISLMAEHLLHLADEAETRAIPLEDVTTWLDTRSQLQTGG